MQPASDVSSSLSEVRSNLSPKGVPFRSVAEAELGPFLVTVAATVAEGRSLVAMREFVGPYGVADMIAISEPDAWLMDRRALLTPPLLNELDALIAAAASVRYGRTPAELGDRLQVPTPIVEQTIFRLTRSGALRHVSGGRVVRYRGLAPISLHAIEAKTIDWKRGLVQAQRYALWADRVTLVLGVLPKRLVELKTAIARTRIGLALNEDLLRSPRRIPLREGRRLWASEFALAALGADD